MTSEARHLYTCLPLQRFRTEFRYLASALGSINPGCRVGARSKVGRALFHQTDAWRKTFRTDSKNRDNLCLGWFLAFRELLAIFHPDWKIIRLDGYS